MTLGHDPAKGYLGTWVGSMMPFMWVYAGELSEDRRVLTLVTEGPNFSGEGMTTYHDVITVVSANERVLTSRVKNDDGSWKEFVWVRYRRVARFTAGVRARPPWRAARTIRLRSGCVSSRSCGTHCLQDIKYP